MIVDCFSFFFVISKGDNGNILSCRFSQLYCSTLIMTPCTNQLSNVFIRLYALLSIRSLTVSLLSKQKRDRFVWPEDRSFCLNERWIHTLWTMHCSIVRSIHCISRQQFKHTIYFVLVFFHRLSYMCWIFYLI